MKQCTCGAIKFKTVWDNETGETTAVLFQCLKCYRWFQKHELLALKDASPRAAERALSTSEGSRRAARKAGGG